ncbi:MAG TPA: hypothetical protein VFV38_07710 [Ktedonobacteraceae bacterium]|nr:hypothetical protein [Ktedonobacteraceae bacterium]
MTTLVSCLFGQELQLWLLAVALHAHPAEELPFADLVRLPELFPFHLTISIQDVRASARFEVNRQDLSWDMVRLADPRQWPAQQANRRGTLSPSFQTQPFLF